MFGKRISLFKLFGFEVRIDLSWLIIGVFIAWSLAEGFFPSRYEDLSRATRWWMGIAGALGLFASIIFHELWHSLTAKRFGLRMKGITLFIFGGVAEMEGEPPSARAEFFMAVAGPLSSILLGLLFHAGRKLGFILGWPVALRGVLAYLSIMNWMLAGFNLIPAYPLDGGRVLRSLLWHWKGNLQWATRVASRIGSGFGLLLIFFGILSVLNGNLFYGLWWLMIGMFLRNASLMSYRQITIGRSLAGVTVGRLMTRNPVSVPPAITLDRLVEDYLYRHHFKLYPVVEDGKLLGCVTTRHVKAVPREEWGRRTAGQIASPCSPENSIPPDADAARAFAVMSRTGNSRLMVLEGDRLTGIITLKDIMGYLSIRRDLGENEKV